MALQFRRVVTSHDASGRAIVKIDEIAKNLVSSRPGATSCVVWTSQGFPVDNTGNEDAGLRKTGTTLDNKGVKYRENQIASPPIDQLFFPDNNNVMVELNFPRD